METIIEIISWSGALILILAYYLLSTGKLKVTHILYHVMNLIGSLIFMIFSMYKLANASVFINSVFCVIAIISIWKLLDKKE